MQFQFRPIEQWPRPFTKNRKYSPFRVGYRETINLLEYELDKISARYVAIQVALSERDIRKDGLPRADARPVAHPGVILSFEKWFPTGKKNEQGQPLGVYRPVAMPCDAFNDWESNLRAIALSLESLRKVDRYGVTQGGEQYKGWAALPGAGDDSSAVVAAATFIAQNTGLDCKACDVIESRVTFANARQAALRHLHPDNGGDTALFQQLQDAIGVLKKHHGL